MAERSDIGKTASDPITGLRGEITAVCMYTSGSDRVELQPGLDREGKFQEARWFDEERIVIDGDRGPVK